MSATFQDLADTLSELEDLPSRIVGEVSSEINELIGDQFDQGVDPYGAPWAPLLASTVRRKGGDRRILRRTDALSSETIARPMSGAGIEITSLSYGGVHQAGETLTKRAVLPDEGELPDAWQDVIEKATTNAFAKVMR